MLPGALEIGRDLAAGRWVDPPPSLPEDYRRLPTVSNPSEHRQVPPRSDGPGPQTQQIVTMHKTDDSAQAGETNGCFACLSRKTDRPLATPFATTPRLERTGPF